MLKNLSWLLWALFATSTEHFESGIFENCPAIKGGLHETVNSGVCLKTPRNTARMATTSTVWVSRNIIIFFTFLVCSHMRENVYRQFCARVLNGVEAVETCIQRRSNSRAV